MKTIAIIVAGGSGMRFGAQLPKQFLDNKKHIQILTQMSKNHHKNSN
jgi:2-C-methyl-D-erythritol 4-phosphate cytidylyltransferase